MLWTFLPIAIVIAAAAYVIMAVRRARREQRARSDERAAAMLIALQGVPADARMQTTTAGPLTVTTASVGSVQADVSGAAPAPAPAPAGIAALRRPRFLTDPQRLLYLVLRAGLPDHIVMANTRMIDLLDLPAGPEAVEHDPRLAGMLHERLDCVVCRNDLVPLAALVIYTGAMPGAVQEQARMDTLKSLGIRFLRFRADSLPRPAEMRSLVLG
jgi:hypothetical protein